MSTLETEQSRIERDTAMSAPPARRIPILGSFGRTLRLTWIDVVPRRGADAVIQHHNHVEIRLRISIASGPRAKEDDLVDVQSLSESGLKVLEDCLLQESHSWHPHHS